MSGGTVIVDSDVAKAFVLVPNVVDLLFGLRAFRDDATSPGNSAKKHLDDGIKIMAG